GGNNNGFGNGGFQTRTTTAGTSSAASSTGTQLPSTPPGFITGSQFPLIILGIIALGALAVLSTRKTGMQYDAERIRRDTIGNAKQDTFRLKEDEG
ncbi:MAG: hypothetical protein OK454_11135, partial [Thaumarchaeota archaeon]|nr:hypothetical protein [Nitrososphaerota archaeon]